MLLVATVVLLAVGSATCASGPCLNPHATVEGRSYWFSWEDSAQKQLNWNEARQFCRSQCMDLVSLEKPTYHQIVGNRLIHGGQSYAWTSGFKCSSAIAGCERADLQPASVYGWYWTSNLQRLNPTTNRMDNKWSHTGGLGLPQPDNRENVSGGPEENCLAIYNNLYKDGITWHDAVCNHRMPFVCARTGHYSNDVSMTPGVAVVAHAVEASPGIVRWGGGL